MVQVGTTQLNIQRSRVISLSAATWKAGRSLNLSVPQATKWLQGRSWSTSRWSA
jgi:hypothetical protein